MSKEKLSRNPERQPLFSPLAIAIVERGVIEGERLSKIINSFAGENASYQADVIHGLSRVISLFQAQRIIDGGTPFTPEEKEEIYEGFGKDRLAEIINTQDPSINSATEARIKLNLNLALTRDSYDPKSDKQVELLNNARKLAEEVGVPVEEVFRRDSLFEEATRRTSDPKELLDELKDKFSVIFDEERLQPVYRESIKKLLESQMPSFLMPQGDDLELLIDEVLKSPDFTERMKQEMAKAKGHMKQSIVVLIGRFWGSEVAEQLVSQLYFSDGNTKSSRRNQILEEVLNERGLSTIDPAGLGRALTQDDMIALNSEVERRMILEQ